MKVSDIMSTNVDSVKTTTSVRDAAKLIFGRNINGLPVVEGKKIVGFITEKDILGRFYPSVEEYMEDIVHSGDFEETEEKISEILALPVEKIMNLKPVTVKENTPILQAQSLMNLRKIGRLPVVNDKEELIGILTKGDIFRAAVGDRLPFGGEEEYHDWQVRHYDIVTDWEERLRNEIPDLASLFRKEKVKDVLDIGYGTGEHDIALAQEGFNVTGIESSSLMSKAANEKLQKLPEKIRRNLVFLNGKYVEVLSDKKEVFQAAIFMGNAFPHLVSNYQKVLKAVSDSLTPENSIIVMQIINIEKILTVNNRVFDVNFGVPKNKFPQEQAFFRFFDPKNKEGHAMLTTTVFDFDGKKWKFRSVNSTPVIQLDTEGIKDLLKKNGFNKVSFFGGKFLGPLFQESFNPKESDLLNVVAQR